jgi:hypothetical protein
MYASGIPMGIITDRKSPRLAAVIGMFALFAGYYPIKLGIADTTQPLVSDLTMNSI